MTMKKMIWAVVRPERVYEVTSALAEAGYNASTKWQVGGRGKQKGIQVGDVCYEEITKNALMVVVDEEEKNEVIDIIMQAAITGDGENSGDGKVFVVPVEESYTISSTSKDD